MSGIYPKAVLKIIPPGVNDPPIKPRIAVLHVAVSRSDSLFDYFNGPSGGVESHFYIRFDGTVEQYRNIFDQADAQLDANDFAVSIETAGMGAGEWTAEQLASIKALLVWLHSDAGIKLKRCTAWDGEGVGYHTMWGSPSHWTPSRKTCPGPDRIVQFDKIIVPWMERRSLPQLFPVRHRVVTANMYVKNPAPGSVVDGPLSGVMRIIAKVAASFGFGPDVIAMQETHTMLRKLAQVGGYQLFVADEGEAGNELGVLLQSKLKCLGVTFHPAADGVKGSDPVLDHPRGIFVVRYTKRGRKVAVVNTHMGVIADETALQEGRMPGLAAEQHAEHAEQVVRIVNHLRAEGFVAFATADANSRGVWSKSLPAQLAAAGMRVTRSGVDLIASDPARTKAPDVVTVSRHLTGSDTHDAIAIRTTERKTR